MVFNKMFTTVDLHVAGEPLRVITGGFPEIKGNTQLERRTYCMEQLDHLREILMHEPRGHHGMYGCIITPPASLHADFGVLFMHNEGWSTMCGHGIIAVMTVGIETGMFDLSGGKEKFIIDTPAGEVVATAKYEGSQVESVSFENVPSFVYKKDIPVEIDGFEFKVDIAFGGAFYAIVDCKEIDVKVNFLDISKIQTWGSKIKAIIESEIEVKHPLEHGLKGIYGVIFSDEPNQLESDLRNVTIFADEQVDRSPCGTGTAARLATLVAKGELKEGESFVHESITNGQFTGEVISLTEVANYQAIIPRISGQGYITGFHQFVVDPRDPLKNGFLLG